MAKILVVDEHNVYQRVYSYILRKHGHKVLLAAYPQDALNCLHAHTVDLAIIDGSLPDTEGLVLVQMLRKDERYAHIPIILLSALGQDPLDTDTDWINARLSKPTSSRELIDTVHKLLGGRIVGGII